jgi:hypothetical protein
VPPLSTHRRLKNFCVEFDHQSDRRFRGGFSEEVDVCENGRHEAPRRHHRHAPVARPGRDPLQDQPDDVPRREEEARRPEPGAAVRPPGRGLRRVRAPQAVPALPREVKFPSRNRTTHVAGNRTVGDEPAAGVTSSAIDIHLFFFYRTSIK